jgi:glycosyltransferase involved in cell wall biosynthesis
MAKIMHYWKVRIFKPLRITSYRNMISVIICSANRERLEKVRENIAATIGVEHELVIITNAREIGGICKGYNAGAAQAVFDTLCFVHDDVTFLTPDWGKRVLSHLQAPTGPALIGLAGSRYKSTAISGWATGQPAFDCCNIFQEGAPGDRQRIYLRPDAAPSGTMVPVTSLDGVLLCMPKAIWQRYPFNAEKLPGFHFYDLDISLRIAQHHTIGVIYDIDLVHYSMGNFGAEWIQHAIHYHRHINQVPLPAMARGMSAGMPTAGAERRVMAFWLNRLMKEPIEWGPRYQWVSAVNALDHLSLWPDVAKMLLYPVKKMLFERKS